MKLPTGPLAKCADCAHVHITQNGRIWKCDMVLLPRKTIVQRQARAYCADARDVGRPCGPQAVLFKPWPGTDGVGVAGHQSFSPAGIDDGPPRPSEA